MRVKASGSYLLFNLCDRCAFFSARKAHRAARCKHDRKATLAGPAAFLARCPSQMCLSEPYVAPASLMRVKDRTSCRTIKSAHSPFLTGNKAGYLDVWCAYTR